MQNEPDHLPSPQLVDAALLLAQAFQRHQIRYALIGGMASGYRTSPRFTRDGDFLLTIPQFVLATSSRSGQVPA